MAKVLHLLASGQPGGIETLCREISKTKCFENGYVFMFSGGEIYNQMKKDGATVYPLFEYGGRLSYKKTKELRKIAEEYDVIIIHYKNPFLEIYYWIVLNHCNIKGIKYVHSCYDDSWLRHKNPLKELISHIITQKTFDKSEKIVYVSNAGKKSCKAIYSIPDEKDNVIYNGISNELLEQGKQYCKRKKTRNQLRLLYIGRLVDIKGVDNLIKAFSRIIKNYNITLTIVGDGNEYNNLTQLTKKLNIEESVRFEGSQIDISKYLANADYFIYPSTCKEVFGISLVEAMAYGIPCIANRVGGIPEVIQDKVNGFLTDGVTDVELENTIRKAISVADEEYNNLCINARRTAERFSIINCINSINGVINDIK